MNYEALPDDLKDRGRFCAWRYEDRSGRRTKVPYHTQDIFILIFCQGAHKHCFHLTKDENK